ncbi:intercellular adhesion molecule 4 [Erinaceus europaeus]|uniref:Intercellular adhesion molecule 4 n=1 Tax=Erinaceus europaeus TaxID=9365 RepID=A0ABM3WLF0_ERIEU|nr:intercellular adhesion molecule 4 [Erinaceus europaeus]
MGPLLPFLLLTFNPAVPGGAGRSVQGRRAQRDGSVPTPQGTPESFGVLLNPEFIAVPPGSSVWFNCSSNCPLPEGFKLHTPLKRGQSLSGPGWVAFQLVDVRVWSSDAHCFVTCGGATRWATARINTYKRPRRVTLDPPVLEDGKYKLRCHITHVFPVGFLVVALRLGGRMLYSESLERFTGVNLANVTLTHVLHTPPRDLPLPVTCHARLTLDDLVVRATSAPITLPPFPGATEQDWHPASKLVASSSLACLAGILLFVGGVYVCRCLRMQPTV